MPKTVYVLPTLTASFPAPSLATAVMVWVPGAVEYPLITQVATLTVSVAVQVGPAGTDVEKAGVVTVT